MGKFKKTLLGLGLAYASATGYAYQVLELPPQHFPEMLLRSGRTLVAGCLVSYDYKMLPDDESGPDFAELKNAVHERSAQRMLATCRANTGVYTKAGQHISSLNYIVPKQYTDILGVLTDKAPFMPMSEVDGVLKQELGADWRSLFSSFEEVPIAAASLAQVHRARLQNGDEVAVKVQFPSVQRQLRMDLATLSLCVRIVGYLFPKFQFTWVLPEFKVYMNQEINFEIEAANNLHIRAQFQDNEQFSTPALHRNLCTKRVVVMEWINGCKMTDVPAIRAMGFHERDVAKLVLENFADQVFVHGFLHSDPHSANAFVRPITKRNGAVVPQLVLLDHGLYRDLDENFRANYAHLWRALVLRNPDEIEKYARALGAGDWYKIFSFILTWRPMSSRSVGLGGQVSKEDIEGVKEEWIEADPNISKLLENLDRELLLVLRTANILRGINVQLGGTVNRYQVNARAALKGIHLREKTSSWAYFWERFSLELTFYLARVGSAFSRLVWGDQTEYINTGEYQ